MNAGVAPDGTKFAFTVDVEDWYGASRELFKEADAAEKIIPDESVIRNTDACLDLLARTGNKATFFILTTICEHYPDVIRKIVDQGHEIGLHGYQHRLLYKMSTAEFTDDLQKSLELLARCGIDEVKGFRAPYWSITRDSLWVLDVLKDHDFEYDSSIFPIRRGLYGIPDAPTQPWLTDSGLWELPPATYRFMGTNVPIAGGGYLRLLPQMLLRPMIDSLWSRREIGIFYCHPYELDPEDIHTNTKLRSATSIAYYLQQTMGRKDNPKKLKDLVSRYSFTTVAELLESIKISNAAADRAA
jgi:polysaccharide deacetylase family protein (PEP-CTERM system associated)